MTDDINNQDQAASDPSNVPPPASSSGEETRSIAGQNDAVGPSVTRTGATSPSSHAFEPGDQIGGYKLIAIIGQGGMGTVYRAQQDRPHREVALKVLRSYFSTSRLRVRFEHEAEVLGLLQHPGIAQVYEAGTFGADDSEQPFFAMELIRGRRLTQYADEEKLSVRQRLALFSKICDAVHHAHQKGVIHRDLKPGNILVTDDGQPKILDFGVARATDSDIKLTTIETDVGQLIGTIPYMSPEQVAGQPDELDTRSDVYALGVVLYELLAGRLPYDLSKRMIHEIARVIREEEPTRLSSINTALRGDVETIVAKALEKEKGRRYQSAAELGTDVRRYLADEPIAAHPPSAIYQLSRFAKRNKALVGGIAAMFIVLVVGVTGTSIGLIQATRAREREVQQRQVAEANEAKAKAAVVRSEQVATFLKEMLGAVDPSVALGHDTTLLRGVLDKSAERIGTDLHEHPEVQAELCATIGLTYHALGLYERAESLLRRSLALRRSLLGDEHLLVATSLENLAATLRAYRRKLPEAEVLFGQALEMRKRLLGDEHLDVAQSLDHLASLLWSQGQPLEAEPLYREALAIRIRLLGDEDYPDVAANLHHLALVLAAMDRLSEAESVHREALGMRKRLFGSEHPEVADSLKGIAELRDAQGRLSDAESLLRDALTMRKSLLGKEHPKVADCLDSLGMVLHSQRKYSEAEHVYREALAIRKKLLGGEHPTVATSLSNLAGVAHSQKRLSEAEALYREALTRDRRLLGDEHPRIATILNNLALVLRHQERVAEAELLYREALSIERSAWGDEHSRVASTMHNLAFLLKTRGELLEAESLYRRALEIRRRVFGEDPRVARSINHLASLLQDQGKLTDAEPLFREAFTIYKNLLGDGHPDVLISMFNLGNIYIRLNRCKEAEPLLAAAADGGRKSFPSGDWRTGAFLAKHGLCLAQMVRFEEAESALLESYQILEASKGAKHERTIKAINSLIDLYESWHATEPGKGYAEKAAEWQAKLPVEEPSPPKDRPAPDEESSGGD